MKSGYKVVSRYLSQETSVMISGSLPNITVIFLSNTQLQAVRVRWDITELKHIKNLFLV